MRACVAAVVAVVLILPAEAAQSHAQLHWSELAAVVTSQKVALTPAGNPAVEGRVIAVEMDALKLQVKKKGEIRIPRTSITTLELRQTKARGWGRITGITAGVMLGLLGAASIVISKCGSGAGCDNGGVVAAAAVATLIGIPVAGYFLGKWVDRKNTLITILPDTP